MSPPPAELTEFVHCHAAGLTLFARRFCATPEDAAQMALAKLACQTVWPADPVAWVYAVCKREALQLARADRRRHRREQVAAARWFTPATGSGCDPEAVQLALTKLPADEAEAITLHLWGGLTFTQIGAVLSVSAATAHRRYSTGLDRLRGLLSEEQ